MRVLQSPIATYKSAVSVFIGRGVQTHSKPENRLLIRILFSERIASAIRTMCLHNAQPQSSIKYLARTLLYTAQKASRQTPTPPSYLDDASSSSNARRNFASDNIKRIATAHAGDPPTGVSECKLYSHMEYTKEPLTVSVGASSKKSRNWIKIGAWRTGVSAFYNILVS